jgi:hypothetical protein
MTVNAPTKKARRRGGRPQMHWLRVRVDDELFQAISEWIAAQEEPKPSTSDATRELIRLGVAASGLPAPARLPAKTLDERIGRMEAHLARAEPGGPPTPEKGMRMLRRGLAENKLRRLKQKRGRVARARQERPR